MSPSRPIVALLLALSLVGVACAGPTTSPAPASSSPSSGVSTAPSTAPASSGAKTAISVGLGYIPSVQFAPFYYAQQQGYYDQAGLQVTFRHGTDYDVIALVGEGDLDLGLADGTSVIPAVSNGIPVIYVATIYGLFPSVVFAKKSSGIAAPKDLQGKKLGIPGKFGSSWIMLQALLDSADLTPDDLHIVEYPDFGQGAAVTAGAVDAATGFRNNEPVQLRLTGAEVSVLTVDEITPLPGNGLIAGRAAVKDKTDALRGFIAATLRAMQEIKARPELGLDAAIQQVPDLAAARDVQAAILDATIEVWTGPAQQAHGLGAIDPADWQKSIDYMGSLGLVPNPVKPEDMIDTSLLPAGG